MYVSANPGLGSTYTRHLVDAGWGLADADADADAGSPMSQPESLARLLPCLRESLAEPLAKLSAEPTEGAPVLEIYPTG